MARQRNKLGISCGDTDCANNQHCFRATEEMVAQNTAGVCIECGVGLIDWKRVHRRRLKDVLHTFTALKLERVRHFFWHIPVNQKAINHARRKGKKGLRPCVSKRLTNSIGAAHPYREGYQTPMDPDTPTILPHAQHATATCCRKCLEYWHGIPQGGDLNDKDLTYLTELVCLYIEDRIHELTVNGERIAPIRQSDKKDD